MPAIPRSAGLISARSPLDATPSRATGKGSRAVSMSRLDILAKPRIPRTPLAPHAETAMTPGKRMSLSMIHLNKKTSRLLPTTHKHANRPPQSGASQGSGTRTKCISPWALSDSGSFWESLALVAVVVLMHVF